MTREVLRRLILATIKRRNLSLRGYARQQGADVSHLHKFLKHGLKPTPKVLQALGYRAKDNEAYEVDR